MTSSEISYSEAQSNLGVLLDSRTKPRDFQGYNHSEIENQSRIDSHRQ